MAKHEMRTPTADRCVLRHLAPAGRVPAFYWVTYSRAIPIGAIRWADRLEPSTDPVTHKWERECTVDRPLVFITGAGRLGRMTKGDDGYHRVEFDILAVANA